MLLLVPLFLEITMLTKARRVATVTAANVCDLFILTGDKLNGTLEEFPEMRSIMEKVALNRLLKLREKVIFLMVSKRFYFLLIYCMQKGVVYMCILVAEKYPR